MTTSVGAVPGGTGFGANVQFDFAGRPEQLKDMAVSVAGFGVIVMWSVTDWPAVTVIEGSVRPSEKSSPGLIANERGTLVAALKLVLPACAAVMAQEPALVRWTVEPVTVQLPAAVKLTVSPDYAVALTEKSGLPNVFAARAPKVIVWSALAMVSEPLPVVSA